MNDDPYAKAYFSKLLKQAIEEAEKLFDHPMKQYALLQKFNEDVELGRVVGIPAALEDNPHARAYYGVIRLMLGDDVIDHANVETKQNYINLSLEIDTTVGRAIAEHSLNPQNIETEIRKSLLPKLFKMMGGLERAKETIEHIIQIVRHGQH